MNLSWTVRILLVIFYALFSISVFSGENSLDETRPSDKGVSDKTDTTAMMAEVAAARKEAELLRRELADVLLKSEEISDSYRRLQLSFASTIANSEKKNFSEQELEALELFISVKEEGGKLITGLLDFSRFLDDVLEKKEIAEADKVRLKFRMDDLKTAADRLSAVITAPERDRPPDKVRILAVNDKLQIVILDAGTAAGLNIGLVLAVNNDNKVSLKVIAVKTFISAAIVLKGELNELAPGMTATPGGEK